MRTSRIDYPVDEIRTRIAAGETQQQIADDLAKHLDARITAKLIYKVCKKHGIQCQRTGPRAGEGHPEWSGGRILTKHGYYKTFCPDHPKCKRVNANREAIANGGYYRKDKYVWEHRLVMEKHLGRYLLPHEVVHHKDDNPANNAIENLELYDSNALHLAETLKGQCPKWSQMGLLRIRAAHILRIFQIQLPESGIPAVAHLLLGIQQELGLDAPPSKTEFVYWLTLKQLTAEHALQKALTDWRAAEAQNRQAPPPESRDEVAIPA